LAGEEGLTEAAGRNRSLKGQNLVDILCAKVCSLRSGISTNLKIQAENIHRQFVMANYISDTK
jgi:hypothetical protein